MTNTVRLSRTHPPSSPEEPIVSPDITVTDVGRLARTTLVPPSGRLWWAAFVGATVAMLLALGLRLAMQPDAAMARNPLLLDAAVSDWWLAIASGSLLLAALLHLVEAEWRCAVSRVPELVSLLAVSAALLELVLQPGSTDPSTRFRALVEFDMPMRAGFGAGSNVTAIVALLVVAVSFLTVRLLPDLAALRGLDPSDGLLARMRAALSRGWCGSVPHWQLWTAASRSIAMLGILVALAFQTEAALRVAAEQRAGGTIVPVLLLVSAILAGAGATAALLSPLRAANRLQPLVTRHHFDILARILLVLGLASLYCHLTQIASTLLNGDAAERMRLARHVSGWHGTAFWSFVMFAIVPTQLLWSDRIRRSGAAVAAIGGLASLGVFGERIDLVLVGAAHLTPSGAAEAVARLLAEFLGTLGLFLALLLLALRAVPIVPIADMRQLVLVREQGCAAYLGRVRPRLSDSAPVAGKIAEFDSEPALVAGIRDLEKRHTGSSLQAYGPVPMPMAADALGSRQSLIRTAVLTGALAGGFLHFALSLLATGEMSPPGGSEARLPEWPYLVAPSICVAAMTGSLAAALALVARIRFGGSGRTGSNARKGPGDRMPECFVLAADSRDQDLRDQDLQDQDLRHGDLRADRIGRVLSDPPAPNARPRSIDHKPA